MSTGPGAFGVPGRPDVLMRFGRPTAYSDISAARAECRAHLRRPAARAARSWYAAGTSGLPRTRRAWLYRLAGTTGWSSLPWLHRLTQPTLVVHGDDDPIVPLINARLIAWRVPDARLEVVEGGGHLLLLDSAADVVPVITEFLTRTTDRLT